MKRSPEFTHSYTQTMPDGREVDVELAFTGYYTAGKCFGPPENCYPPDSEVNIETATTDEDGEMDFDAWATKHGIPEKDLKDIEDMLMERIQEGD